MAKRLAVLWFLVLALALSTTSALAAPSIDPVLQQMLQEDPLTPVAVAITYNRQPTSSDINHLKLLGVSNGIVLNRLPMILTHLNKPQFDAVRARSSVVSLYANHVMELLTSESRTFIGVSNLLRDAEVTVHNGGLPVSGKGVGVAVVDTGIDATHNDLRLGVNVVQNVNFPLTLPATIPSNCPRLVSDVGLSLDFGFAGPVFLEDQLQSDLEGGHGTFVAGVIGGTGQQSGGFYGGVAPGADLIGLVAGNDCGLTLWAILQSFDYILVNQVRYNIRVVNNSWGSTLAGTPYDPFNPIQVATRELHDRFITVVFAAGNAGSAPGAINPYSVAPWVISVAASEKFGLGVPAGFSSRGEPDCSGANVAGQPADPHAPPSLCPDLTAPGADIKSARNKGAGVTNLAGSIPIFIGANDLWTIPPAFLPFYTTSQGTSFSAPHVAGVVALMKEANPQLSPDDVVTILRATANPMPQGERAVGVGYLDAHNAVRAAIGLGAVPAAVSLFPTPDMPQIIGAPGSQLGTNAQDIRSGRFDYDAATNELVYTLTLTDTSTTTTNMRWTMSSNFGPTNIFVHANVTETGAHTFGYGSVAPDPDTGVNTQTNLGPTDLGEIGDNRITWRLNLEKIDDAVGFPVLGTTATNTNATSWIRIGTTLTPSLLFPSDSYTGSDFVVGGNGNGGGDDPVEPVPDFCERFAGAVMPGAGAEEVAVEIKNSSLDAKLNFHPGNQPVSFVLEGANGTIPASESNGRRIRAEGLTPGNYTYRIGGALEKEVDYVINSCQSTPAAE